MSARKGLYRFFVARTASAATAAKDVYDSDLYSSTTVEASFTERHVVLVVD